MKALLFFLFITPFTIFAQSASERSKIVQSYDQTVIANLITDAKANADKQSKLIADYKKQHPFLETEQMSLQRIEEDGTPIFYTIYNQGSSATLRTNRLYPSGGMGLSVTGLGMTAGVWDGGKVRDTHVEFAGGKVALSDAVTALSIHSTHVTGTIIAAGTSPTRRGIAYQANAKTYDWNSDYTEMLAFGAEGYLVSNHSYGYNTTSLPTAKFGAYDASSIEIDNASNANPYYQMVVAAGNDRNDVTLGQVSNKGGYDLLSGFTTSKNAIVVAAIEEVPNYIDSNSVIMSEFSNYGPTDDGRIKPDVCAKGVAVNSTTSIANTSYGDLQGTSMAAPAITGLVLMLQKHFNNTSPATFMRASTVRGLICHSTRETGLYPGPDCEFGWGLPNAELAANIITNRNVSSLLEENTLATGQTFTKLVSISSAQKLQATICWTDPTGTANATGDEDNRTARLRNNLDLKIVKDGTIYYPWKLDAEDVLAPATNISDNNVDNVEKVEIELAQPGVYTIQVTHKGTSLVGGSQVFSLIANATNGLTLNNRDYEYDNSVFIYPNPASSVLNFDVKNDITISGITINDISGKEIFRTTNAISNSIDISNLSSGVYFVTFQSDSNSVTKKFIKQ